MMITLYPHLSVNQDDFVDSGGGSDDDDNNVPPSSC